MSELVSILIPVFNREHLIEETMMSALNQTYKNIEVIVVDNASTDNTWKVVSEISKKDSRVKCFRNHANIGPVKNWKRCIDEATGFYGKILWSDDLISPNYISKTLPLFKNKNIGFVFSSVENFNVENKTKIEHYKIGITGEYKTKTFLEETFEGCCNLELPVSPGCAIFRMESLQNNLLIDIPNKINSDFCNHAIGNDLLLYLLTCKDYSHFGFVNEVLSYFRSHDGSITVSSKHGKIHLHYLLVQAYYVERYYKTKIRVINTRIKNALYKFPIHNEFNIKSAHDFYMINKDTRISVMFILKKILFKISR